MRSKLWLPEEDVHAAGQEDLHAVCGPEKVHLVVDVVEEVQGALVQGRVDEVIAHAQL